MSLRRPPTRIELKVDDIEEYEEILKERERSVTKTGSLTSIKDGHKKNSLASKTNEGKAGKRKQRVSERIGLSKG